MSANPYRTPYSSSLGKEIDLRQEMTDLLYGSNDEIAKGRRGLLRHVRREDNIPVRCPCRDRITDEPDKDFFCRTCHNLGYLWDEVPITYFQNDKSFRLVEGYNREYEGDLFFVEYDVVVYPEDYIITVRLNSEGNVIIPIERDKFFKVLQPAPFRADNGRIEFWAIRCMEERQWSVWYGVKHRQYG